MIARYAPGAALWMAVWIVDGPSARAEPPPPEPSATRQVRPPDDPGRRGVLPVPPWAVWGVTAVTVAGAAGVLLRYAMGGDRE